METTDTSARLNIAFCSLTNAVEGKSCGENQRRDNLHHLKLAVREEGNELVRLEETLRELHAAEEEENAQDEATSIDMTRQIAALEDSSSYWAVKCSVMRSTFRVNFRFGDPSDPTKVTLGFFLGKKDVAKRTLFLTEDPSVEQVDAAWTNLKEVHEERTKKLL